MTIEERRDALLKSLKQDAGKSSDDTAAFVRFAAAFFPLSTPDDLLDRDDAHLIALARHFYKETGSRAPGKAKINVMHPRQKGSALESGHTVITIVNDDMPFLVDSVTACLTEQLGYRIHMMHHPIHRVVRDKSGKRTSQLEPDERREGRAESLMFIEMDAESDKDALDGIKQALGDTLGDVRQVVGDFRAMLAKIDETVAALTVNPPPVDEDEVDEAIRFLRWMGDNHFTFLGFREYRFEGDPETIDFEQVEGSGLGILRDRDRYVLRDKRGLTPMSPEIRSFLTAGEPVLITKANVKATVHRRVHMDYVGVKIFDEDGKPVGERRFIGLFTSLAYSEFAEDVPLLRRKVARIRDRALFARDSHAGKALAHILETFPRDELFQISEGRLYRTALGVLQLTERPRPRAFIRQDRFERFVSALVFVPRATYHADLRQAIGDILCEAYDGEVSVYYANLSENTLARWHFIIRTTPGAVPHPDEDEINRRIADAAQGWSDRLLSALINQFGEEDGIRLSRAWQNRFGVAYRAAFSPDQAVYDVAKMKDIVGQDDLAVDLYHHKPDGRNHYRLKIYHGSRMVTLARCMPILENMGFRVLVEHSYEMAHDSGSHIHEFRLDPPESCPAPLSRMKDKVEALFLHVWHHHAEDDPFNALVARAGLGWDEIVVLRAYGKYLRQLGFSYTPDYLANCMGDNPDQAATLLDLFRTRFDPDWAPRRGKGGKDARAKRIAALEEKFTAALEDVASLDQDRILRGYRDVISATVRTNYFQDSVLVGKDEKALAFKIKTRELEEAPRPKPFAEIWVYSPRVEGVHLRGGPVARGGLRWSDRPEDFRTEVLGLVKAQQVKNAVIVPQGAKGGFFPKQLPGSADREGIMQEGIACYRSFIASLLSITDNLENGKVVKPERTHALDGDDPYLVVAADKGTASFSDIANSISLDRGFWLGDAFASGGQHGYDHKKMGITARGAWVSVQRHFREIGINTQTDPISVIGIGDMGGDVFGNGMLLSRTIRLKAAFNHMHIFIDPNPGDGDANWQERKRLFDAPRSSWEDYDQSLISKGGGVFKRSAKAIDLTPEIQSWLGVEDKRLTPAQLIHAILQAEADLLWFGGIGTYVRDKSESNADVGDRANDALRITADQLAVKAVGEGGNLGMTQKARITFARRGGRINTDFIDNSAGVDCSDKEVNIKILLDQVLADGRLKQDDRNQLLEDMTDSVSAIVLSDNYLQTQAISLAEEEAVSNRENHLGLIRLLERDMDLDREIENLPTDEGFAELAANESGLTRPEIATLMAYAKMSLFDILQRGDLVNDPWFRPELEWGFPDQLTDRFPNALADHRLRREIVATVLANAVVNWAGLTFVYEVKEETGLSVEDIIAAFVIVRDVFNLEKHWEAINALDYDVRADIQHSMHRSLADALKNQVLWLLRNLPQPFDVKTLVARFREPVGTLFAVEQGTLSEPVQHAFVARRSGLREAGVPQDLAIFVAAFEQLQSGLDIITVSEKTGQTVNDVAAIHFALGDMLGFDWLRQRSDHYKPRDRWEALAIHALLEDLTDQQRVLVTSVCNMAKGASTADCLEKWKEQEKTKVIRAGRLIDELRSSGSLSVAKLSFAVKHMNSILK
ncbi:NAD-glutamate dehydrogenase [Yunchengibacter salinarum]|uniref:NAD-glutamate dehydrogenase n=1 Tax=Yunchengibacter salinarum TaxID=3133399 RepID=UPI0035B5C1B4